MKTIVCTTYNIQTRINFFLFSFVCFITAKFYFNPTLSVVENNLFLKAHYIQQKQFEFVLI